MRFSVHESVKAARRWNHSAVSIRRFLPHRPDLLKQAREQRAHHMRIARHRKTTLVAFVDLAGA